MNVIYLTFYGEAEPAGSKKGYVRGGHAQIVDANPRAKGWKERVAQAAGEQYDGPLLQGALGVSMLFYRPRPRGHFGTGRNAGVLRASAPAYPTTRPDVLKTARSVEDSLTGVIYRDDSQIVAEELHKHYGEPARCEVVVWEVVAEERAA